MTETEKLEALIKSSKGVINTKQAAIHGIQRRIATLQTIKIICLSTVV